jgi:hypothetical protein
LATLENLQKSMLRKYALARDEPKCAAEESAVEQKWSGAKGGGSGFLAERKFGGAWQSLSPGAPPNPHQPQKNVIRESKKESTAAGGERLLTTGQGTVAGRDEAKGLNAVERADSWPSPSGEGKIAGAARRATAAAAAAAAEQRAVGAGGDVESLESGQDATKELAEAEPKSGEVAAQGPDVRRLAAYAKGNKAAAMEATGQAQETGERGIANVGRAEGAENRTVIEASSHDGVSGVIKRWDSVGKKWTLAQVSCEIHLGTSAEGEGLARESIVPVSLTLPPREPSSTNAPKASAERETELPTEDISESAKSLMSQIPEFLSSRVLDGVGVGARAQSALDQEDEQEVGQKAGARRGLQSPDAHDRNLQVESQQGSGIGSELSSSVNSASRSPSWSAGDETVETGDEIEILVDILTPPHHNSGRCSDNIAQELPSEAAVHRAGEGGDEGDSNDKRAGSGVVGGGDSRFNSRKVSEGGGGGVRGETGGAAAPPGAGRRGEAAEGPTRQLTSTSSAP